MYFTSISKQLLCFVRSQFSLMKINNADVCINLLGIKIVSKTTKSIHKNKDQSVIEKN